MTEQIPPDGRPRPTPIVRGVRVRNFKSIAGCDVELGMLTVLVGRNGAGKSNFLDALRFVVGSRQRWYRSFPGRSMSDGTLRALATLVAVAQPGPGSVPLRLVGIEEPESALHPAASGALMDALKEAALETKVIVTTQSPDLLDRVDPDEDRVLVVENRDGETVIGTINRASREAVKEHLYSLGELLRMDQLRPDHDDVRRQSAASASTVRMG